MGLPPRSPISDRFQGTTYMTFGCSRSPVTVAVPKSSRSVLGAGFWPAGGRGSVARDFDGAGGVAGSFDAGWFEVSTCGSPASDCAVGRAAFAEGAAGAVWEGAAGADAAGAAGAAGGAACCCASAGPHTAQHRAIELT